MDALERETARIRRRKAMKLYSLADTRGALKYIATLDQPEQEHGGFHDHAILAARSALHHLRKLSANNAVRVK